ncbi:hypothetical protein F5I97DRAFT_1903285 [Phlebopus sp. FC_14]|nr:hypothetical protein F5I97DRAFT_1903285 [Phlebopus sp. FC_14]
MSNRQPPPRFAPYRNALTVLSARTGTPLPSLIFSFTVLHELTAVVPLVGVFFAARGLGVGERVVNQFARLDDQELADRSTGWMSTQFKQWVDEGEQWAGRVGRRYGIFGYEKGQLAGQTDEHELSRRLAGDVANAVLAYASVKALMPVRVGLSLYLSPAFSRRIIDPISRKAIQPFKKRRA